MRRTSHGDRSPTAVRGTLMAGSRTPLMGPARGTRREGNGAAASMVHSVFAALDSTDLRRPGLPRVLLLRVPGFKVSGIVSTGFGLAAGRRPGALGVF